MIKYSIGDRYGKLTIVSAAPSSLKYPNKRMVLCKCDCGNEVCYPITYLVNKAVTSCGCGRSSPKLDIRGKRFGKLVAIEPTGEIYNHSAVWKFQCDCGNVCHATAESVMHGRRTGCGCTKSQSEIDNVSEARKNQIIIDGTNLSRISSHCMFSHNTSGYKGVSYHKGNKKWVARISVKGKTYSLGYFERKEDAYKARLDAEDRLIKPILEKYSDEFPKFLKKYLGEK